MFLPQNVAVKFILNVPVALELCIGIHVYRMFMSSFSDQPWSQMSPGVDWPWSPGDDDSWVHTQILNPVILWSILNESILGEWWSLFLTILYQYINIVAIRFTVHRGSWFDMITLVHAQFYTQNLNVSSFLLQKKCDTSQLWVMYRVVIYGKIKYGLMRSNMTING